MDSSIATLSSLRNSPQRQTRLGKLCGSRQLCRDRYQILKTLGRGGFGVTFLARDMGLPGEPLCVIKQLCPKVSSPAVLRKASERFEREAAILGKLGSHSQIPLLLDYFQIEGEFYLVQEYVKGCTIAKEVRQKGPLSEQAVKQFLVEILPVLSYVHRNKVIHRDIKPPNIIRCEDDNRLVLIDFGAVKEQIAQVSGDMPKSANTGFVGTVGFAPPEQVALRPMFSSDIYALGVTCLYMLTGHPPMAFDYDGRTGEIDWKSIVNVSDHFSAILDKMLRISLPARYHWADEVVQALELEPHFDNLSACMTQTVARPTAPSDSSSSSSQSSANESTTHSPFARKAANIRQWRDRMRRRQNQQDMDERVERYGRKPNSPRR